MTLPDPIPLVGTNQHSIRVPDDLDRQIEMERRGRPRTSWSDQVLEILEEGIRMRRCPGVVFRPGAAGRRAVVEGTGVDVWEVVLAWNEVGHVWDDLRQAMDMLSEAQLRAALNYHALYPAEIDERIAVEAEWTPYRPGAGTLRPGGARAGVLPLHVPRGVGPLRPG